MLSKITLVVMAALLALGCTEEPRKYTLIGFSEDEITVAQDAAAEWCATGAYCPLVSGGSNSIELVDGITRVGCVGASGCTITTRDLTPDGDAVILIWDRRVHQEWINILRRTLLHEFGHAAGCADVSAPGVVMSANEADEPWHLTESDVACAR